MSVIDIRTVRTRPVPTDQVAGFDKLWASAPLAAALVDRGPDARVVAVNAAFAALAASSTAPAVGQPLGALLRGAENSSWAVDLERFLQGAADAVDAELPHPRLASRTVRVVGWEVDGGAAMIVAEDVTLQIRERERLADRADRDPLTGVLNGRRFREELARQLVVTERYHVRAAVLMLDLDGFKQINDAFGHAVGDAALCLVASVLQEGMRRSDLIARLGGDEFAVLLGQAGQRQAELVAATVRRTLAATGADRAWSPSGLAVSIGIALLEPGADDTTETVLARADRAMYADKPVVRRGHAAAHRTAPFLPPSPRPEAG